jgi:thiamine phosphate synthase YjbQ (UPF0047 family)
MRTTPTSKRQLSLRQYRHRVRKVTPNIQQAVPNWTVLFGQSQVYLVSYTLAVRVDANKRTATRQLDSVKELMESAYLLLHDLEHLRLTAGSFMIL